MKHAALKALVASVRPAGRIRRGARNASRTFTFRSVAVTSVRMKLGRARARSH
jgi:hypothetical protein